MNDEHIKMKHFNGSCVAAASCVCIVFRCASHAHQTPCYFLVSFICCFFFSFSCSVFECCVLLRLFFRCNIMRLVFRRFSHRSSSHHTLSIYTQAYICARTRKTGKELLSILRIWHGMTWHSTNLLSALCSPF